MNPDVDDPRGSLADLRRNFVALRRTRSAWRSALGIAWFWAVAVLALLLLPRYAAWTLGSGQAVIPLLASITVGFFTGMVVSTRLSRHQVEIGLVPLGALGMVGGALALALLLPESPRAASIDPAGYPLRAAIAHGLAMFALGASAAVYIAPLEALIRRRVPLALLGSARAAKNTLIALGLLIALGVAWLWTRAGGGVGDAWLALAAVSALVALYLFTLMPEFLLRLVAWFVANVVYRLDVRGRDNIPVDGPALVVCNHVSYMDAIVLLGAIPRPTRFVMYWKIFDVPVLKWIFKAARAIPIAPRKENATLMDEAFATVATELAAGEVCGIFPEGGLTKDGAIQPFKPGVERILESNAVPVVPMALSGLWGSVFSRKDRVRVPRRFWSRVRLSIGEPIAPERATAELLEARVRALRGERP